MNKQQKLAYLADRFDIVTDGEGLGLLDNRTSQIYRITEGDTSPTELRRLALDEMRNPVGAHDKIMPNDEHPLNWLVKETNDMPNTLRPNNGNNFPGEIRERFGADADPMDAETLLHFVTLCMQGLPNDGQATFATGLQGLLSQGAADARRRSGRRPAQDAALRALNNKSFNERFPFMKQANIKTSGY
jgi:hypothetical protein